MAHNKQVISMTLAMILAAATTTLMSGAAVAQSSDECTNVLVSLSPCLNYISGNSSAGSPSASCCTQLGTVVGTKPQCLCEVLNGGGSNLGININKTQALALPKACKLQTPSASLCNAASPNGAPGGSKNVPSSGDGSSDATTTRLSVSVLFFLVFTTCYASIFEDGLSIY